MLTLKKFVLNLLFHKRKLLFKNEKEKFQFLRKIKFRYIKLKITDLTNLIKDKYTIIIKDRKILEITIYIEISI